jgi:hypothetical protein
MVTCTDSLDPQAFGGTEWEKLLKKYGIKTVANIELMVQHISGEVEQKNSQKKFGIKTIVDIGPAVLPKHDGMKMV